MAHRPGARANEDNPASGPLHACGRLVGFALFAGLSLAMFGAVVLVPAYVRWTEARFQADRHRAAVTWMERKVAANERFIRELPRSEALTTRLLAARTGARPAVQTVLPTGAPIAETAPKMVWVPPVPPPERPRGWVFAAAERIRRRGTRRGLVLLACLTMATALFAFATPRTYRRTE